MSGVKNAIIRRDRKGNAIMKGSVKHHITFRDEIKIEKTDSPKIKIGEMIQQHKTRFSYEIDSCSVEKDTRQNYHEAFHLHVTPFTPAV